MERQPYQELDVMYNSEMGSLPRAWATGRFQTPLALAGVELEGDLKYVDVWSKKFTREDYSVAYSNYASGSNGIIICNENFRSKDKNANDKKMWPIRNSPFERLGSGTVSQIFAL